MRASDFFRERASLERLLGRDSYSGDTFYDAESIWVRWLQETQQVQTASGREVLTMARVSTMTPLSEGDRLEHEDGHRGRVVRVRRNRSTDGRFSHYVADLGGAA